MCQVEGTEHLVVAIGSVGLGDVVGSCAQVAVLQGDETLVGVGFSGCAVDALGLGQELVGLVDVALGKLDGCNVVVGTVVVGIELCGFLVDGLFGISVVLQACGIEQFFDAQLAGILLILSLDLVVAAANGLVVDDHARAAELGQNAVGKLTETG